MNDTITQDAFRQVLALLNRLQAAKIAYTMRHSRPDALMIQVNVPGERWEIEFVDYDDEVRIEVERFRSEAGVLPDGGAELERLFAENSD
jgi:hypothetical protein